MTLSKPVAVNVFGKTNVVAQKSDRQWWPCVLSLKNKKKLLVQKMREIVSSKTFLKQVPLSSFTDSYPAMGPTEGNAALSSNILSEVSAVP